MIKKTTRWLFVAGLLLSAPALWAQALPTTDNSSVQLEISDCYGDKQTIPLSPGMTLYWPQHEKSFGVLADKDGVPRYSFPFNPEEFAYVKFLNAPAASGTPDMSAFQPYNQDSSRPLRFDIGGQQYWFGEPGEMRFSSPLDTYEFITADGQRFTIPMAATELIHYQDTLQSISSYLGKLQEGNLVYQWAFYNGQDYNKDVLHEYMYAMFPEGPNSNTFSLLIPSDEAFAKMPDIISFPSQHPRVISITTTENMTGNPPIKTGKILYHYDPKTGVMDGLQYNLDQCTQAEVVDRLKTVLRSHVIVHNRPEDQASGLYSGNEYFLALDGSPIHILREGGKPVAAQGTFQLWNQEAGRTAYTQGNLHFCRQKGNGAIYEIDQILDATPRNVHDVLSDSDSFSKFFELCQGAGSVFFSNGGLTNNDLNFIRDIPFTLYVPTNEAIEKELAINKLETQADTLNFVKAHIQFGIEIADQIPFERSHKTVLVKEGSQATPSLFVKGLGKGKMTVTDECGNTRNILDAHKNIFVREVSCILDTSGSYKGKPTSPQGRASLNNIIMSYHAPGVIHQIDGVLKYKK